MIDLTKPIRRKSDRMPMTYLGSRVYYRLEAGVGGLVALAAGEDLDAFYENIPEPRKPRGWWLSMRSRCAVPDDGRTPIGVEPPELRYLIEWPIGAPLPDWPEE